MKKHFKTNDVLEITDVVNGRKVSARFGPNCKGLYAHIEEPLQIIPLMHAEEYAHENGFIPSGIELKEMDNPSENIDISYEHPDWKVYIVAYKRESIKAGDFLNSYNNFLKKEFIQFPSNIIIKSANRQEINELGKKADYQESGLLFFSNPDDNDLNPLLNPLSNYPIQYKLKV